MRAAAEFGPEWLAARLAALLPAWPAVSVAVAFSGGGDSLALLAALCALPRRRRPRGGLRAIHVDHGLQAASRAWARECRRLAIALDVPLAVRRVAVVAPRGTSLEAAAREARYAALARLLREGEVLLTAHHLEDQAETVLLQLLRGAGLAGLAAMPVQAPLGRGVLLRPLLELPREALRAYVTHRQLAWIEDPMNADPRFDRAFVRAELLARLAARWPGAPRAIARSARHAQEAQELLEQLAQADLDAAADGDELAVTVLRRLAPQRRRNLLRLWIARRGGRPPGSRQLAEIAGPLLAARADAQPRVEWPGGGVRRYAGRLLWQPRGARSAADDAASATAATAAAALAAPGEWRWRESPIVWLPGARGRLGIRTDRAGTLDPASLPDVLELRWRIGGERLRPRAGGPSRSVKSLLQAARIAPWERAALPLVYAGGRLVAVADLWIDAQFQARAGTRGRARIVWHRSPRRARPGGGDLLS